MRFNPKEFLMHTMHRNEILKYLQITFNWITLKSDQLIKSHHVFSYFHVMCVILNNTWTGFFTEINWKCEKNEPVGERICRRHFRIPQWDDLIRKRFELVRAIRNNGFTMLADFILFYSFILMHKSSILLTIFSLA